MFPLSTYLHKAMIPFSGVPFLAYSIAAIPKGSEIVIIVSHFREQIANYFRNSFQDRKIMYFAQDTPRGTGDALFQFGAAYRPKEPIIVWQADQLIFREEFEMLSGSGTNAGIYADAAQGLMDLGFWKLEPNVLPKLKDSFDGIEYRALPVLERQGLKKIKTKRQKLEISFESWKQIEVQCKKLKQEFFTEFH